MLQWPNFTAIIYKPYTSTEAHEINDATVKVILVNQFKIYSKDVFTYVFADIVNNACN